MDVAMMARASKSVWLYAQVRRELRTGRFVPGERIDPNQLAQEFATSPTPVLYALHRLVGEGTIHHQIPEGGFQVPLATERMLRELYDWMQWLMVRACDLAVAPRARQDRDTPPLIPRRDGDVVRQTRVLFEAIARDTGHHRLYFAVRCTNDRLEPIRRAAQPLLPNASEELAALTRLWLKHDLNRLKAGLIDYHERRKHLVPHIVAVLDTLALRVPDAD